MEKHLPLHLLKEPVTQYCQQAAIAGWITVSWLNTWQQFALHSPEAACSHFGKLHSLLFSFYWAESLFLPSSHYSTFFCRFLTRRLPPLRFYRIHISPVHQHRRTYICPVPNILKFYSKLLLTGGFYFVSSLQALHSKGKRGNLKD